MNLLALDISSKAIGVAIFLDDELQELTSYTLSGDSLFQRIRASYYVLNGRFQQHTYDCLAIEAPAYGAFAKAAIAQQRVVGAIISHWLSCSAGQIIEIPPATAKLTLCGNGKADKQQMIAAARMQLPGRTIDEHSADAYAVGLAGLGMARQDSYQEH